MTIRDMNKTEDRVSFPRRPMNDYQETLSGCVEEVSRRMFEAGAVLVDPAWQLSFDRPVNYGCTETWNFEIASLKGKRTGKFFHVNIYRLESGRYELNTYVL